MWRGTAVCGQGRGPRRGTGVALGAPSWKLRPTHRGVYIDVAGVEKVVACLVASHTLWQVVRLEKLDNLSIATLHKARPVVLDV